PQRSSPASPPPSSAPPGQRITSEHRDHRVHRGARRRGQSPRPRPSLIAALVGIPCWSLVGVSTVGLARSHWFFSRLRFHTRPYEALRRCALALAVAVAGRLSASVCGR